MFKAMEGMAKDHAANIDQYGVLTALEIDRNWDLISICNYTEFCIDQFWIPLGVQSTDATANRGLAPKPPESGWYPQCLPL